MWPAIMRTVRRGAPGTAALQRPDGRCSIKKTVVRLLVAQGLEDTSCNGTDDNIDPFRNMAADA